MFNVPFAPPSCPRCSSKVTEESDGRMVFLCGTELLMDDRDDSWAHDWSESANIVCRYLSELREQVEQMEQAAAGALDDVRQLRVALAFARSVIKGGESWSGTCDEVIDGALTATKPIG